MHYRSTGYFLGYALLILGLTVTALEAARMELPSEFEATAQRIATKGKYTPGEYFADFTRTESRLGD